MRKDFFNGNIKPQFVSYTWTSIIIVSVVFFGFGGLLLYLSFLEIYDVGTSGFFLVLGVISFLFGLLYSFGTIFVIRKYPRYKKITKWFLNSDYYFVDCNSKEYRGHRFGKYAFKAVTSAADQEESFTNLKYPKKYYVYVWATVICLIFMFAGLIGAFLFVSNMEKLPQYLQNEDAVSWFIILFEIIFMVLSFVFVFHAKKISKIARKEYFEKMIESNEGYFYKVENY